MVDLALTDSSALLAGSTRLRRSHWMDRAFHRLTFICALFVLLMFAGIIAALVSGAWPAIAAFGLGFLVTEAWNPVTGRFGALAPIYGTLVTSLLAMLI